MEGVLHLEGAGGVTIPYQGYVEANLTILDLPYYQEDVLFLAVENYKYGNRFPVQMGMQVIDQLVSSMAEKELQRTGETWRQFCLSTIVSKRSTFRNCNAPEFDSGEKR